MSFIIRIVFLLCELLASIILLIVSFGKQDKTLAILGFVISTLALFGTYFTTTVPEPEIWPKDGSLSYGNEISITSERFVRIYYTLDSNSDPAVEGIKYTEPFEIPEGTKSIVAKSRFFTRWSTSDFVEIKEADETNMDTDRPAAPEAEQENQLSLLLEECEKLVEGNNYEEALRRIRQAKNNYPNSEVLLEREKEYSEALEKYQVSKILEDASKLAEQKHYGSAIALLKETLNTYKNNAELTNAYNEYRESYKNDIILNARELADNGNYLEAIQTLKDSHSILGNTSEFEELETQFTNDYINGIISEAEKLIDDNDFDNAERIIDEAKKHFPDNLLLEAEGNKITSSRPIRNDEIIGILNSSVLSQSGTYKAYLGNESINAYAEDQFNAFSINTAASYNMWGGGVQNVSFRLDGLNTDTLRFTICGETGTSGSVSIDIFLDRPIDDSDPNYSFYLDDAPYPQIAELDISARETMAIRVTNHAGHENRIVFYGFEAY